MGTLLDSVNLPQDIKNLTIPQLKQLAEELRTYIIQCVSKNGGHLASNLGVVELTLALHYVFDTSEDKIIWDVGHQCYTHKIITGRKDEMQCLRKVGGPSGFPRPWESLHDAFSTGHSSTAISAALGMARARDIKGENHSVIAVVGDGSMTGGMCFEALNDAGHTKTPLIVILNDNEMSIEHNVGAMTQYLSKMRSANKYNRLKDIFRKTAGKLPWIGPSLVRSVEKLRNRIKYFFILPGVLFEQLGFTYVGPFKGHNIRLLIEELKKARKLGRPVLIHALTKKGKGYPFAEDAPEKFHGIAPFYVETGEEVNESKTSNSEVFAQHLAMRASQDKRIVAITAAMQRGTGLLYFSELFPERFFDVGIAEEHAATMAAGLAMAGMRPYFAVYSTFLQRAYDQLMHDICLQSLPVVFAVDKAGIAGEDGETHNGMFDISFLRHMPNIVIMSPADLCELKSMTDLSLQINRPMVIRYSKGCLKEKLEGNESLSFGKWKLLRSGEGICILSTGRMVYNALEAARMLESKGISCAVVNCSFLKPMDNDMLEVLSKEYHTIYTIEENVLAGGFGSAVGEYLNSLHSKIKLVSIGLPDKFIPHGSVSAILDEYGLSPSKIALRIQEQMNIDG